MNRQSFPLGNKDGPPIDFESKGGEPPCKPRELVRVQLWQQEVCPSAKTYLMQFETQQRL
jgi:hypothetical protein